MALGTSLQVQWFRVHASNAGDTGSTSCRGTKIPHAAQGTQEKDVGEGGPGRAGRGAGISLTKFIVIVSDTEENSPYSQRLV